MKHTGTPQVGAPLKPQKAQGFKTMLRTFSMKNSHESVETPKEWVPFVFRKFAYSVLCHIGALFPNLSLFLRKTLFTCDITSKIGIVRKTVNVSPICDF